MKKYFLLILLINLFSFAFSQEQLFKITSMTSGMKSASDKKWERLPSRDNLNNCYLKFGNGNFILNTDIGNDSFTPITEAEINENTNSRFTTSFKAYDKNRNECWLFMDLDRTTNALLFQVFYMKKDPQMVFEYTLIQQ